LWFLAPLPYWRLYGTPYYGHWLIFGLPFYTFWLLFLLVVFGSLLWPWGWYGHGWYRKDRAEEIIRQRYARGELTREQFEQMMKDLEQHR